jgi:hypothetical protein
VTAKSSDGGDLQPVVYVVAVEDPPTAVNIVGAEVWAEADIEVLGQASQELLNALKLTPGQFPRT